MNNLHPTLNQSYVLILLVQVESGLLVDIGEEEKYVHLYIEADSKYAVLATKASRGRLADKVSDIHGEV